MASGSSLHIMLRQPTDDDPVCWHRVGSFVDQDFLRTITTECDQTLVADVQPEVTEGTPDEFKRIVESPGKPGAKEHRCTGCYGK